MRREPTELSLLTASKLPLVRQVARTTDVLPAADALDAAFEEYSRVDVGTDQTEALRGPASRGDARSMTKNLIADIATQLDILDRQREQLAALLRDVDTSGIGRSPSR